MSENNEPILSADDIEKLKAAGVVLRKASARAFEASSALAPKPSEATSADAMSIGRFRGVAESADDALFTVLNIGCAYLELDGCEQACDEWQGVECGECGASVPAGDEHRCPEA